MQICYWYVRWIRLIGVVVGWLYGGQVLVEIVEGILRQWGEYSELGMEMELKREGVCEVVL
jgi:hypothetical protein